MGKRKTTKPRATAAPKKKYSKPVVEPEVTEFLWRGKTRYKCSKCQFDASTESEAHDHYQNNHVIHVPKAKQVDTGLVASDGGKIVRVEEVQNGEN